MYAAYFGLRDHPFSITPDPGYLYMSAHHQEALAHLVYGTGEHGGFVQLTGEVGTGKTTLIRTMLAQHLDKVDVALILNPRVTVLEFVAAILDELKIAYPPDSSTLKLLVDALNVHLLSSHAQGLRTVLIIDEAQNLSREVLEQVRLLTNLETHRHKLLRIILVGQPELKTLLAREDMRQLSQRITARYHLEPLGRRETASYVQHRLSVAGGREGVFTTGALATVHRLSQGIPRLINIICDRALLGAYVRSQHQVDRATVRRAAREALQGAEGTRVQPRLLWAAALVGVLLAGGLLARHWQESLPVWMADPVAEPATEPTDVRALAVVDAPPPAESVAAPPAPVPAPVAEPPPVAAPESPPVTALEPPPSPPSLDAMLATAGDPWQGLLAAWGETVTLALGSDPCAIAAARGLDCLHGRGDLETLRRYNRPALITLQTAQGERQVLLRALNAQSALLELEQGLVEIDLVALAERWAGDYLLLWRPPTTAKLLTPGMRGPDVLWLRRQLALAAGESLPVQSSALFDAALAEQVRRFQQVSLLDVDGLVGARTLLLLSNLAPAPGTPLLASLTAAAR